jgi:CBS domain-containing protein
MALDPKAKPGEHARDKACDPNWSAIMTTATGDLRVGNLMTIGPVVIGADAQASEAERLLKTHHVSGLPVVSGDATVGVISQTDLVVARSSGMISANWERVLVRHLMTAPAVTVRTGTSLAHAARLMVTRQIHRLVVVDDEDAPIGVLSSLDLLRVLLKDPDIGPDA